MHTNDNLEKFITFKERKRASNVAYHRWYDRTGKSFLILLVIHSVEHPSPYTISELKDTQKTLKKLLGNAVRIAPGRNYVILSKPIHDLGFG